MFVDKDKEKEILDLDTEECEEDEWDAYGEEEYRRLYPEIVEAVREYIRRSLSGEYKEPEKTKIDIREVQMMFLGRVLEDPIGWMNQWYENKRKSRKNKSKVKVKGKDSN